ncbi:MAG: glycerol-3-phosphate cytidylyltransferase [Actinobacteria bacterium HGW-Actinobacteria-11]|nr:MAG: glycerol-3-phosphate cytidylyltransferase [Actinobacteria bacterium HGW-Actinobacteria-11]
MTVQTIQSIHPPDRADATQARRHDDNPGPRVGITFSTFDLLHAGHIMMLAEAKRQCDYLIVGLQMDPTLDRPEKNAPTQTVVERYIQLRGCQYVDEIVPYSTEQDVEDILRSFTLDVRIVGDEYRESAFTGREHCEESGIDLYFNGRDHRFSSSGLRRIVAAKEAERVARA